MIRVPTYVYIYVYKYTTVSNGKWKTQGLVIFLNPFTVYSSCKRKFVVCPFVDEETKGSHLVANGLNRLAHYGSNNL
jgi:hypothetical protein